MSSGAGQSGEIDSPEAFQVLFGVSRETLERLKTYEAELLRWQPAVNLVAPATLGSIWHRHFADSAQLMPLLPAGASNLVDLGTGGGFPGLVLAIMGAETGLRVTLVEADRRKSAFLGQVARAVGIAVDIVVSRIESIETQTRIGQPDVITARALAPFGRLVGWSLPLFGADTTGVFLKGRDAARELEDARKSWDFEAQLVASVTDNDASIVVVRRPKQKPWASKHGV
jgi:16S rRNA (guanine527-N7)-methyltransferase